MTIAQPYRNWLIVVPARLNSQRLPEKPLQDLGGRPLIVRVAENLSPLADKGALVIVATDSARVQQACARAGVAAEMTKTDHPSGTDRTWEIAARHPQNFILNVQGDEPDVACSDLEALMQASEIHRDAAISTLVFPSEDIADFADPNIVKAIRSRQGYALYFTRASAPYHRDTQNKEPIRFWQHIGVYAFRRKALEKFCQLPPGKIEQTEKLEQLRALENDVRIWLEPAAHRTTGIDTPADLEKARAQYR